VLEIDSSVDALLELVPKEAAWHMERQKTARQRQNTGNRSALWE